MIESVKWRDMMDDRDVVPAQGAELSRDAWRNGTVAVSARRNWNERNSRPPGLETQNITLEATAMTGIPLVRMNGTAVFTGALVRSRSGCGRRSRRRRLGRRTAARS